jgi:hypothetical protein
MTNLLRPSGPPLLTPDLLPAVKALDEAYAWVEGQRQKARDDTFAELHPPSAP